ncbi:hypothetical protein [Cohnella sp. AR92]|uniref:hypothetical protein n=1 Tax=Cohnella sp. AR92 TaxID=648716 RepID=UPI000F8DE4FA|nr:hypothetical protein [Cohnella sp. AR92]RUS44560.1 hypothetical protein ELR57_22520 [Cohnella sp. AR92]
MGKIFDFLSHKAQFELINHNFKHNDEIVEKHGKYIGVLTKQRTESLRQTIDMMEFMKKQVEQLMSEYEELRCGYEEMVMEAVNFLGAKDNIVEYDPEGWDFYVDVKGHCWVIKKAEGNRS